MYPWTTTMPILHLQSPLQPTVPLMSIVPSWPRPPSLANPQLTAPTTLPTRATTTMARPRPCLPRMKSPDRPTNMDGPMASVLAASVQRRARRLPRRAKTTRRVSRSPIFLLAATPLRESWSTPSLERFVSVVLSVGSRGVGCNNWSVALAQTDWMMLSSKEGA